MSSPLRAASRRGALVFSLFAAVAASVAARPATPGVTYRVRIVVTPPDIPGMPPQQGTVIVGHGAAAGSMNRLEIDSVQGQLPMAIGDIILTLDSGRVLMISQATKSYTEGMPALASLPPELLAQAQITNVNVTNEKLGAGESMQGFATEKIRMTATYTLSMMGTALNTMTTSEMWVAQLPSSVTTPFDGAMPKELSQGPMKELADKLVAARKTLGTATPLKTVITSTITGPMTITTVTTVELVDVKTGDVDASLFKVPEGFTKKP